MAPISRSQKQKENTESDGSSTKTKNYTQRATNRRKSQSQTTSVNIIDYRMHKEWLGLLRKYRYLQVLENAQKRQRTQNDDGNN